MPIQQYVPNWKTAIIAKEKQIIAMWLLVYLYILYWNLYTPLFSYMERKETFTEQLGSLKFKYWIDYVSKF